jgi:Late competence development protein ComFB
MDIASIHNHHERIVFDTVLTQAENYPHLKDNDDTLADVACVALNRLPARYIRHDVDMAFFLTERERDAQEIAVHEAVEYAFGFVQARNAMRARG